MATFYVAPPGSGGSNSNDGSSSAPWATITFACANMGGGNTLIIRDGVFTDTNQVSPPSGSSGSWTVIKAENKWGAILQHGNYAAFRMDSKSYISVEDIRFNLTAGGGGVNAERCHHVAMRGCRVIGTSGTNHFHAGTFNYGEFYTFENNVVSGLRFNDFWSAFSFYQLRNITGDTTTPGFRNFVLNNTTWDCYQVAGNRTDGNGIIIDDAQNGQSGTPDFGTWGGISYPYPTLVEGNLSISNGSKGIQIAWSDHVTARNNSCYKNNKDLGNVGTYRGEIGNQDSLNAKIINNLTVCDRAINNSNSGIHVAQTTTGTEVRNSLTWDVRDETARFLIADGGTAASSGNIAADPLWVDPDIDGTGDFHLQSGSTARNAGTNTFGLATLDLGGDPRVSGAAVDMGAYEFQETTDIPGIYIDVDELVIDTALTGPLAGLSLLVRATNPLGDDTDTILVSVE